MHSRTLGSNQSYSSSKIPYSRNVAEPSNPRTSDNNCKYKNREKSSFGENGPKKWRELLFLICCFYLYRITVRNYHQHVKIHHSPPTSKPTPQNPPAPPSRTQSSPEPPPASPKVDFFGKLYNIHHFAHFNFWKRDTEIRLQK